MQRRMKLLSAQALTGAILPEGWPRWFSTAFRAALRPGFRQSPRGVPPRRLPSHQQVAESKEAGRCRSLARAGHCTAIVEIVRKLRRTFRKEMNRGIRRIRGTPNPPACLSAYSAYSAVHYFGCGFAALRVMRLTLRASRTSVRREIVLTLSETSKLRSAATERQRRGLIAAWGLPAEASAQAGNAPGQGRARIARAESPFHPPLARDRPTHRRRRRRLGRAFSPPAFFRS